MGKYLEVMLNVILNEVKDPTAFEHCSKKNLVWQNDGQRRGDEKEKFET